MNVRHNEGSEQKQHRVSREPSLPPLTLSFPQLTGLKEAVAVRVHTGSATH